MFHYMLILYIFYLNAYFYLLVCQSVDIRNTPEGLKNLTDCEVVEGFVQILLIENANSTDYANYSFPKVSSVFLFFFFSLFNP